MASSVSTNVFEVPEFVSAPQLATACAALLLRYGCEGTLTIRTISPGRSEPAVVLLPVELSSEDQSFEQMVECAHQLLPDRLMDWSELEILLSPEILSQLEHEADGLKIGFQKTTQGLLGIVTESRTTRMAEHLQALLRGAIAAPSSSIFEVEILGEQEKQQILLDWNQTEREYPEDCVPELVEAQARRTPHAVALIQGDQRLTYRQLNEKANRLANYLRNRGVGPEVMVGFCVEQSLNAVVAVLGILKAGGAYVPLDPSFPDHRLQEMVSDAKPSIAVTSARCRDRVPHGVETICIDRDSALIAAESSSTPAAGITPDSAAYVLYTSASTGKPKGVVGIHRSITNGLHSATYAPGEVCCLNTFLSYGFSIANLFLPLISGVPVVVLTDEQIRDSNQMMAVLEKEGVTRLVLVPSVLKQILDPDFGAASRLRKITTIGVAGAKLTTSHFKSLAEAMPHAKLQNRYAGTEVGTVAAVWDLTEESLAAGDEVPIGRPVANTRIYILDRSMNPVPVGVTGDIYIGAAHMARGYLNRPDLTEERFIPDPFSAGLGQRLFRTGDLGRFRASGEIEFRGRADDQVKINGFRVDSPEVERALTSHIGVSEALIAVREVGNWQRLVAYVVVKPLGTPSASQLTNYLRERLPAHMAPSRFVFLKELPMLSNGKVNRSALPMPEPMRPALETRYQPPGSPIEAAIAQIWSDLLELDPIGIHDQFRDLGGDSMSAAQVAVRLADQFGVEITPEALFDHPTIAELAIHLAGVPA